MPYTMTKVDGYRVSSPHGTKARSTTKVKAQRQMRLLNAVEQGWRPTGKKAQTKGNRFTKGLGS